MAWAHADSASLGLEGIYSPVEGSFEGRPRIPSEGFGVPVGDGQIRIPRQGGCTCSTKPGDYRRFLSASTLFGSVNQKILMSYRDLQPRQGGTHPD